MIHHSANGGFAIRQGKWKLILLHKKSSYELYDLTADVKEDKNVISGNTDLVASLWNQFSEIISQGRSTPRSIQKMTHRFGMM